MYWHLPAKGKKKADHAVLASELLHLPDKPAGVGEKREQGRFAAPF
jgi:hypothetical protein